MHACRPTANSIWNSFRSSGKRHLVLTGAIGSGKTTLLSELFLETLPGITTWAERRKAVFMKDNLAGTTLQIADYDDSIQGTRLKMVLRGDVLCTFGVPILRRCLESESEWVTIDEIGFLEQSCEPFQDAIRDLFEKKRVVAVVRKQDLPFLNELRSRADAYVLDLDQPSVKVGCVIMASGLGKRFGGNKLMADFHGEPMILRALDASRGLKENRVVVTRHEDVAKLCRAHGVKVVLHDLPHRSDTVRLGMEALGDVDGCMFLPADQPLLQPETVEQVVAHWVNHQQRIVRPFYEDTPGSPVIFPRWTFEQLRNLPEGKGGGWVMKQYPESMEPVPISDPYELMDADTPETLEILRQRAGRK